MYTRFFNFILAVIIAAGISSCDKEGKEGKEGKPGSVVTIGGNCHWFIDGKDTGKSSRGSVITIGDNGNWYIDGKDTGISSRGSVISIGDNGNWFIDGKDTGISAGTQNKYLNVNPDTHTFEPEGGEFIIQVSAHTDWNFDLPTNDWLTVEKVTTPDPGVKLTALKNTNTVARVPINLKIYTLKDGLEKLVTVEQKPSKPTLYQLVTSIGGCAGFWEFQDANNLTKSTIGNDLVYRKNYNDGSTSSPYGSPSNSVSATATDGFSQVAGVKEGDFAVLANRWRHFFCNHGVSTTDGVALKWSVVMDVKRPGPALSPILWNGLITTDTNLINDTDFWINNTTAGALGQGDTNYYGSIGYDTWHRLVIVVSQGEYIRYYQNGVLIRDYTTASGVTKDRYKLREEGVILFGNRNGGDYPLHVSGIAIFGKALSEDEATSLGGL